MDFVSEERSRSRPFVRQPPRGAPLPTIPLRPRSLPLHSGRTHLAPPVAVALCCAQAVTRRIRAKMLAVHCTDVTLGGLRVRRGGTVARLLLDPVNWLPPSYVDWTTSQHGITLFWQAQYWCSAAQFLGNGLLALLGGHIPAFTQYSSIHASLCRSCQNLLSARREVTAMAFAGTGQDGISTASQRSSLSHPAICPLVPTPAGSRRTARQIYFRYPYQACCLLLPPGSSTTAVVIATISLLSCQPTRR